MTERLYWIDIAKGIAMLLVILGHITTWEEAKLWIDGINFFHVPIWIFLSALFINTSESIIFFIKKRAIRLLKPYYIYAFLVMIIHVYNTDGYINILLGERKAGAIWFLPLLFSTSIISFFILKLKLSYQILVCIGGLIISYILTSAKITLPLNIDIALYMLLFVVIANHYRIQILKHHYNFIIAVISLLLLISATTISNSICPLLKCNFFSSHLGIIPITIFLGLSGFYLIFYISQWIEKHCNTKILSSFRFFLRFVGKNSMIFIIFHQKLCFNLIPFHRLTFLHPAFVDLIAFMTVISFCCIATFIINKYFKFTIS